MYNTITQTRKNAFVNTDEASEITTVAYNPEISPCQMFYREGGNQNNKKEQTQYGNLKNNKPKIHTL